jgi:hypothetical protein
LLRRPKISLSIKNESAGDSPDRGIERYDDFKKPFDELWEWAITPRFSLDRSVKTRKTIWIVREAKRLLQFLHPLSLSLW